MKARERSFIDDKFFDEEKEARLTGRFVAFSGLIYKEFNPNVHVVKRFHIPKNWTRFRGIDPGINNPTACIWWAVSPDNDHYIYNEYCEVGKNVQENAANIKILTGLDDIMATYIDPSACNRNMSHPELRSVRDEYSRFDLYTVPANNDVSYGVNKVKELLKVNDKTGTPKLHIFHDCYMTLKEIRRYRWDTHRHHAGEKAPKESPKKVMDHCMDVIRYIAAANPFFSDPMLEDFAEPVGVSSRRFTKYG